MNSKSKRHDLEDRLVEFAVQILDLVENLPKYFATNHLGNQLIRSGTSAALNYGEAQAAESRRDFIHKLKVCLKELRESQVCLKIIKRKQYLRDGSIGFVIKECGELIAILITSIKTASK
jgi:four helix bundle protein